MSKVRYEKDESLLLTVTFFINLNSVANRNSSPSPYLILFRYIRFPLILISFSVCTSAISCNYGPNNPCEKIVPWPPERPSCCLTPGRCMENTCGDGYTKHKEKFDQACKTEKKEAGIPGWENYKCCASDTDIKCDVIAKY